MSSGFQQVFDFLVDSGCSRETAWLRGIRLKFGLKDTSKPGSLLKPAMYFHHEQLLRELAETDIIRLFVGKISQEQRADFPRYKGAVSEQTLKEFLKI